MQMQNTMKKNTEQVREQDTKKKFAIVKFEEYEGNYIDSFEFCRDDDDMNSNAEFTASEVLEFLDVNTTYYQWIWLSESFETVENVPASMETYWHHKVCCVIPYEHIEQYDEYFELKGYLTEEDKVSEEDYDEDENLTPSGWVKKVLADLVSYADLKKEAEQNDSEFGITGG